MIRAIRKALRGWLKEATHFWGRFNTFYRMVFAIGISIALIYGMRAAVFDPAQKKQKQLTEKLAKDSVPEAVPSPDTDEDVQQQKLKTENTQRNVEVRKKDLAEAEKKTRLQLNVSMADATTEALRLAGSNHLRVIQNADAETSAGGALPSAAKQFELMGDFHSLHAFLHAFSETPILWQLTDIVIDPYTDDSGKALMSTVGTPLLRLRCKLLLYLYREKNL